MKFQLALALICLYLTTTVQAGVYKCPDGQGGMRYQQVPCDDGEEMKIRKDHSETAEHKGMRPGELTLVKDAELNQAARRGKIMVGMTAAQVKRAIGPPNKIDRSTSSSGVSEQWSYRSKNRKTRRLSMDDGILSRWSD